MANPTTNFGWVMPTSTSLVTNLPADFNTFGQGVDTSMAQLKGGTTGQILSKTSATDMAFTWITPNPGDITGITATSPLTGGGTSGDVTIGILSGTTSNLGAVQLSTSTSSTSTSLAATASAVKSAYDLADAAIPKSTVTTTGDLIYATGSAAVTRLAAGTSGYVLTSGGASTAPSWSAVPAGGGMTLLSTTTHSGATTTVSSISQSYTNLFVYIFGVTNATADGFMRIAPNGTTNICYQSSVALGTAGNNNDDYIKPTADEKMLRTNSGNAYSITINNYASTTSLKTYASESVMYIPTYNVYRAALASGGIATTSAISSLVFSNSGGNCSTGTVLIYGVK
jgi:hypothetical protein